jgi:hypothetical protein
MSGIGNPQTISQTFDAIFHLNGVRYIVDTGDASPFTFLSLSHAFDSVGGFYPNLWHGFAALVAETGGASIPMGVNAANVVIAAIVWPVSCMFLVRQIVGARPVAMVVTGAVAAGFWAFPMLLFDYGVLYPDALSIALLPGCLAALVSAMGFATDAGLRPAVAWLAFAACLPGLALAHPSSLVALIVFGSPLYVLVLVRWFRRDAAEQHPQRVVARARAALIAIGVIAIGMLLVLRPTPSAASWGPAMRVGDALAGIVLNAQVWRPADIVLTVLGALRVVGLLVTRRHRWLIVSLLLAESIYLLTATLPRGILRYGLTGTWYSDVWRLAGLVPVMLTPVAVYGIVWAASFATRIASALLDRGGSGNDDGRRSRRRVATGVAASAITLAAVVLVQTGPAMAAATASIRYSYELSPQSHLLDTDEFLLLERIPRDVPKGMAVAGDPWTGTALVWAIGDRRAIMPHIYGARSAATLTIMNGLRNAGSDPGVCRALKQERVGFALDFGTAGIFGTRTPPSGLAGLATSSAVVPVDRGGSAVLYKVTPCA